MTRGVIIISERMRASRWGLLILILPVAVVVSVAKKESQKSQAARLRKEAMGLAQGDSCEEAVEIFKQIITLEKGRTQDDYNNMGVCYQMLENIDAARNAWVEGIAKFYHSEKLHTNLGLLLEDMAKARWFKGQDSDPETEMISAESNKHLVMALRLQLAALWDKNSGDIPKLRRIEQGKQTVAIFYRERELEGLGEGSWGPSTVDDEAGAPEAHKEATVHLARHLVKLGFNVELYANVPKKEYGLDKQGVNWRPFYAIHGMLPPVWNETHVLWPKLPTEKLPDAFISVGNTAAAHLYNSTMFDAKNLTKPSSYLWARGIVPNPTALTLNYARPLHGIITQGTFHDTTLPGAVEHCLRAHSDGVEQAYPHVIRQSENSRRRFVYAGPAQHGLDVLLREWPSIRKALAERNASAPEASLEIIGAFPAASEANYGEHKWYRDMKRVIEPLLQQPGVIYKGEASRRKTARAMTGAGFLLYPTGASDVTPPGVAKAMLMGCIPVTSRHNLSGLSEATGRFDLGPEPEEGEIKGSPSRVEKWSEAVVAAANMEETALASHREAMVEWARERYRWGRVADGIAEMIRKDVSSGRDGACGEPIWQVRTKDPETGETCDAKPEGGSAE